MEKAPSTSNARVKLVLLAMLLAWPITVMSLGLLAAAAEKTGMRELRGGWYEDTVNHKIISKEQLRGRQARVLVSTAIGVTVVFGVVGTITTGVWLLTKK